MAVGLGPIQAQVSPRQMSDDLALGAAGNNAGDGHRASPGPASLGLARATLPNSHGYIIGIIDPNKFHVGAIGKGRVFFNFGPEAENQIIRDLLRKNHAMRIAHGDAGYAK